jgi:hypothetical protein
MYLVSAEISFRHVASLNLFGIPQRFLQLISVLINEFNHVAEAAKVERDLMASRINMIFPA